MKTNGLPPSRLMEKQRLDFKRNLSNEFEFLAGSRTVHDTGPSLPTPVISPSHGPAHPVLMPGQVVHLQPLVPMPGWSEARPEGGVVGSQMSSSKEAQLSLVPRYLQPHVERSPHTLRHPGSPTSRHI